MNDKGTLVLLLCLSLVSLACGVLLIFQGNKDVYVLLGCVYTTFGTYGSLNAIRDLRS